MTWTSEDTQEAVKTCVGLVALILGGLMLFVGLPLLLP